ncbi:hypothetical protein EJB05_57852 [Eragrostis curvula]|uniref:Uncharacterized protein n=1 Tax=Eragrostis curvula TaxID=38414 RepID=A0A5J9SCV2_9POAL|nr:hypothetical protein EJB05_57852 [Eragrostis curvula]
MEVSHFSRTEGKKIFISFNLSEEQIPSPASSMGSKFVSRPGDASSYRSGRQLRGGSPVKDISIVLLTTLLPLLASQGEKPYHGLGDGGAVQVQLPLEHRRVGAGVAAASAAAHLHHLVAGAARHSWRKATFFPLPVLAEGTILARNAGMGTGNNLSIVEGRREATFIPVVTMAMRCDLPCPVASAQRTN